MDRCKRIESSLVDYVLDDIPYVQKMALERHLRHCETCQAKAAELKAAMGIMAVDIWENPPEQIWRQCSAKLQDRLAEAFASEPVRAAERETTIGSVLAGLSDVIFGPFRRRTRLAFGTLAVLVVASVFASRYFLREPVTVNINYYLTEHISAANMPYFSDSNTSPFVISKAVKSLPTQPWETQHVHPSSDQDVLPAATMSDSLISLQEALSKMRFKMVAPPWICENYILAGVRIVEEEQSLQLIYTDGLDIISLFERPSEEQEQGISKGRFVKHGGYYNYIAWQMDGIDFMVSGREDMEMMSRILTRIQKLRPPSGDTD